MAPGGTRLAPVNDLEGYDRMVHVTRARIAGLVAISLLMLSAPGAMAGSVYQPDAQIRKGSSSSYLGVGFYSTTGTAQHAINSGVAGQKLTFFIKIVNQADSTFVDAFKVRRSAGYTNGYRVRYYDAANNDVTGQVTNGTFTTPIMGTNDEYVMRATVKIQSWATACSSTSRLITVTSVNDSFAKDAVRFTAELDSVC